MSDLRASHNSLLSNGTKPCLEDLENEKANMALIFERYKDRIIVLPKEKGWHTENLYLYQGHWFPSKYLFSIANVMGSQKTFQAMPSDIYLATLPKSGTTWIKALTFAIVNRTMYKNNSLSTHKLLSSNPHDCVPFIENEILRANPTSVVENCPRIFATHTPYTSLPQSIIDCGCRIVYVCRNPKDVLVSLFHFANKVRDESLGIITFEEAFKLFCEGVIPSGPYWDHVKGYYKATSEHPARILFLTYENMSVDIANIVKNLAKFLGYPFTKEEEAAGIVEEVVKICSFEKLREVNKHGNIRAGIPKHAFFREGRVGDWSNHLTDEMSHILDQITKEKFRDEMVNACISTHTTRFEAPLCVNFRQRACSPIAFEVFIRFQLNGMWIPPTLPTAALPARLGGVTAGRETALKAANDPNQPILDNSGQVWTYDNDLAREMTMKCVIQMALPFGHFDNTHITNMI
ncbi:hypothetical protein OSB04_023567 [Centaurea solstitialis]|uniref:Sulfotransferase n=1 Tax=Centaurea solstitialis TaxID=347529 RepID=A0AA38W9J8_9ASTR|nr:hypothetical protein OSB04_023567 [Centaurea solstitialis]